MVRLGATHVLVVPGEVDAPNAMLLGARAMANAQIAVGDTPEAVRAALPAARRVVISGAVEDLDGRHLARSLQGLPVTEGDAVAVDAAYGDGIDPREIVVHIEEVTPGPSALIGNSTIIAEAGGRTMTVVAHREGDRRRSSPTTADALLAGLDVEVETLSGWLSLLTSPDDLTAAWGLPSVAGVLLAGPIGCGKSELVAVAADRADSAVHEVSLELVFKPDKLLQLLEAAVKTVPGPAVLFVDRLDSVVGDDAMFRDQVTAILRWFLDAVAEKAGVACVLGLTAPGDLPRSVGATGLVPRTLTIPPPDLDRRALLFEAALAQVPSDHLDYARLAARTAGFSGADVLAAVVHASALAAGSGSSVDQDLLERALAETTPSLGATSLGEIPSYGFERVANLDDVKQRLTESVIWQMREPERFERLGIEPPRGLLLYGPPGTGKTFVVRALAHESGAAFFPVKGAELLDKYVGESERGVREVFARARTVAPAILFFDEIDALAPIRGNATNSVTDSVVAALLTEMDGVAYRGDVFVIGATNRRDLVDPALVRPGRLETHVYLGVPAADARRAFFAISDVPFAADVDHDRLILRTEGLTFADLSGLLREAALVALRRDSSAIAVTSADLEVAINSQTEMARSANRS